MALLKLVKKDNDYPEKIDGIYYIKETPVQTFYVGNVSDELNKKVLERYFSKYGVIDSVIIRNGHMGLSPYRYSIIKFKSAKEAVRLFEESEHHIINNKMVCVKIGDIWHQPTYKKQENTSSEPENELDPEINIFRMKDDCLVHILSYLSLRDQFAFSCASKRFRSACEVVFKRNKSLVVSKDDRWRAKEVCKLIRAIGPYLKEITIDYKDGGEYCAWIPIFAANICRSGGKIEVINLLNMRDRCDVVVLDMLVNFEDVKALSLEGCDITDDICRILKNFTQIETLNLCGNKKVTGKYLDKLSNLKKLIITQTSVDLSYMKIIAKNTKLKELYIGGNVLIEKDLKEMFTHLTDLEGFCISIKNSNVSFADELVKLKNLRYLGVYLFNGGHIIIKNLENLDDLTLINCLFENNEKRAILSMKNLKCLKLIMAHGIDDSFLDELAVSVPLRKLSLSSTKSFTQTGIISFIQKCRTIDEINISGTSGLFDNAFVFHVIDTMLEVKRTNLKLIVKGTEITKSIENEEKFRQNKGLVKLRF